jgi:hypothetical protein
MAVFPTIVSGLSRFWRRGAFFLFPPIRFNMPIHFINNGSSANRLLTLGDRVIKLEEIHQLSPHYEQQWDKDIGWVVVDDDQMWNALTKEFGEPIHRVRAGTLILESGEKIVLDQRQYWKIKGVLMQSGVEV